MSLSKLLKDPMEYSKHYPCLYGLRGKFAIETETGWIEVIKNGSSFHIANRKSGAITYFPRKPYFEYVIVLEKDAFQSASDLYILDAEFVSFLKQKGLGEYYIKGDGGTDWFYTSCPFSYLDLRLEFLQEKGIPVLSVLTDDPFPIRDLNEKERVELQEEDEKITRRKSLIHTESLYDKFCKVFLSNKVPRRIQSELWNIFSKITNQDKNVSYKGIVQWPTGTGKTIAILMKIVLAKEWCERNNIVYRGLFVSPKNDILDTISQHFNKLSEFGIHVYDGSNAMLSKLTVPTNEHCLVMACHAALINEKGMKSLPPMNHIHYDEVHRITGELYFKLLKEMIDKWKTNFLTGTSATPQTSSADQRKKITELFGDPLTTLHKCEVHEAVEEGWIAKPRFQIRILEKQNDRAAVLEAFVDCAVEVVLLKNKGGKSIFYIESCIEDVKYALEYARKKFTDMKFYAAIDGERTDGDFLKGDVNTTPHILFACQRYREGSDIPGLEITGKLTGDVTAAHNLIQISGRALRIDYPDKEGWCLIAKPCDPGTTAEDVLASILLDIIDFLGKSNKTLEKKDISQLVKSYIGELSVEGNRCSIQETIDRIQTAYARIEFIRRTPKERYSLIQSHNKELGLQSKYNYFQNRDSHPRFIEDPQSYFKDYWISWYHFLGIDTSSFPQTKSDWVRLCKGREIRSWEEYKSLNHQDLPINPGEMYPEFSNWDSEFGVEEEIVW